MKKVLPFTTTMSVQLLTWLHTFAKEQKKTRREILEEALVQYRTKKIKEELAASFERASKDPDMLVIAEEGMDDYFEQLQRY